ncbi:unnamed protein product [Dovyalis caffra]|uniref:Uncharacterized protein n=1 Tax=Dovyalis caffra TaxID=77055 RepID=A0AAV1SCU7_9ROSI|nr:unnamed protein product [Dovyalis caffra]
MGLKPSVNARNMEAVLAFGQLLQPFTIHNFMKANHTVWGFIIIILILVGILILAEVAIQLAILLINNSNVSSFIILKKDDREKVVYSILSYRRAFLRPKSGAENHRQDDARLINYS